MPEEGEEVFLDGHVAGIFPVFQGPLLFGGVELAEVAGGLQFRTAADLAPRLRRVVTVARRLPRAAMAT